MKKSSRRASRLIIVLCLAVVAALFGLTAPASAATSSSTSATWSEDKGQIAYPSERLDTSGQAIDAHSTSIVPVQSTVNGVTTTTYYMYGESYGCGWTWGVSTTQRPFCGFNIYSSPDLQHWTKVGPVIANLNQVVTSSGGTWQNVCDSGCFRPKVVYNQSTGKYVLWINVADRSQTRSGYIVMTSSRPDGGFTYASTPQLAGWVGPGDANGDENIFVDTDGTAWAVYTRIEPLPSNNHWLIIERLNSSYTDSETRPDLAFHSALEDMTGKVSMPAAGSEAPSLFKRGSTYYLVFGPACPYCAGTPTYYAKSTTLTGTWGPATKISQDSCGGQPDMVLPVAAPAPATTSYLYLSDQWQGGSTTDHNVLGTGSQALSQEYTSTLSFDANGNIAPISCQTSETIGSLFGSQGSDGALPAGWQGTDTSKGVEASCPIYDAAATPDQRVSQAIIPQHPGTLNDIWVSAFQRYRGTDTNAPNAPLLVQLFTTNRAGQQLPQQLIGQFTIDQSAVSWTPSWVKLTGLNIAVTQQDIDQGKAFDIVLWSPTTTGCYGVGETNAADIDPSLDGYSQGFEWLLRGSSYQNALPFEALDFRSNL